MGIGRTNAADAVRESSKNVDGKSNGTVLTLAERSRDANGTGLIKVAISVVVPESGRCRVAELTTDICIVTLLVKIAPCSTSLAPRGSDYEERRVSHSNRVNHSTIKEKTSSGGSDLIISDRKITICKVSEKKVIGSTTAYNYFLGSVSFGNVDTMVIC